MYNYTAQVHVFVKIQAHHDVKFKKYVVAFLFKNVVVAMASYIG